MDEVECRLKVYIKYCIPLSFRHTEHKSILSDTSIVDQYVYAAEISMNLLYYFFCLLEISGIASICTTCYAQSFDFLTCCFESSGHIVVEHEVGKCDVCAFCGKFHCDSFSDAACCSCDKSSFTC